MSAPRKLMQDAETIRYGFLSARTSDALAKALQTNSVTGDDAQVLSKAAAFLRDISDGARFTSSGTFRQGAAPARSMAALDLAFGPMQSLRRIVSERDDVATFFSELADAVSAVKETGHATQLQETVLKAKEFFEELNGWLSQELRSRRPTIGRRRGRAV